MESGLEIIGRVVREAWEVGKITENEMNVCVQWLLDHNQSES